MTNRFKFRAWHKESKQFYVPSEWDDDIWYVSSPTCAHRLTMRDFFTSDEFVVTQTTGLKDRNNKEIFEGDIITKDGKVNGEVRYIAPSFFVVIDVPVQINSLAGYGFADGGVKMEKYTATLDGDCEVVGNIFENPTLLSNG